MKSSLMAKNLGANLVDFDNARSPLCYVTSKGLHISVIQAYEKNVPTLFFIGQ